MYSTSEFHFLQHCVLIVIINLYNYVYRDTSLSEFEITTNEKLEFVVKELVLTDRIIVLKEWILRAG